MKITKGTWILLATILGSSMAFIDANVVNVALPRIQLDLNASAVSVQWVVEAYALFLGALILVGGSLGDRLGRKRIFAIGIVIFALASIVCGSASTIAQLITARAVQGIGGAMLTPGSLAIIRASFDEQQRGRAIGLWSGFSAITSALGPVIGGWLVQNASWRWVFFINIPLAVLVLIILFRHVPESREDTINKPLDIAGALLATSGLGMLVFGLIESNTYGLLSPLVLSFIVAGSIALALFLWAERRSPAPMLPLVLFRSHTFSAANIITFFLYAALGGALFFLPFNLIRVQGYSAVAAGSALLPFTLLLFVLSRWSGGLMTRYGSRLPLSIGPFLVGVGYLLFAIPDIGGSYWTTYFPAIILLGLGMSITVPTLTTTVMGAVTDSYAGIASGVNNAVARIASLFAIAIFGIIMLVTFNVTLDSQLASLHISPALSQSLNAQRGKMVETEIPVGTSPHLHTALSRAIDEAFMAGFRLLMLISAGLAFISALCAWLLVSNPGQPSPQKEEHTVLITPVPLPTHEHTLTQQIDTA